MRNSAAYAEIKYLAKVNNAMYLLDEIFKNHQQDYSGRFCLRMQRGLSWLRKAKDLDEDVDLKFVSLWIAFNAIYAENLHEIFDEDQQHLRQFLQTLHDCDQDRRIEYCVWEYCAETIANLANNPYVDQKLWDFRNKKIDEETWKQHFATERVRIQEALLHHQTIELLLIIFGRFYTVRNQLIQGGSTYNSALMRKHLKAACEILMKLLTQFMHVLLEHSRELDRDKPFYPMVQVC